MARAEPDRVDRTIELAATPERVWNALTTAKEIGAWFRVTIEGTLTPGADVRMRSTDPQHAGAPFQVRIVEMDPPRRLVWQWHPGAVDPAVDYSREPRTTVTFTLERTAGGTRLHLSETGFTEVSVARRAKVFLDNSQGWTEVLTWFKTYVEKRS